MFNVIESNMKWKRSVIFSKNSLINKIVKLLLEKVFSSYCNAVVSTMNKVIIEKNEKYNIFLRDQKHSGIGVSKIVYKIQIRISMREA